MKIHTKRIRTYRDFWYYPNFGWNCATGECINTLRWYRVKFDKWINNEKQRVRIDTDIITSVTRARNDRDISSASETEQRLARLVLHAFKNFQRDLMKITIFIFATTSTCRYHQWTNELVLLKTSSDITSFELFLIIRR